MRRLILSGLVVWALTAGALDRGVDAQSAAAVTILHINDIYEIDGIGGGRFGGLPRAATVVHQLERSSAPVLMTLGGDYLSPSAIGTAIVDGAPLAGRQMVDVLNRVGLDWAVLGNHEFDLSEAAFRLRLTEGQFGIVATNVSDANGQPFPGTVRSAIVPMRSGDRTIRVGLLGLTVDYSRRPWVRYSSPIEAARAQIAELDGQADAVIALTHLPLSADHELVTAVPAIDLVLGGHEHENVVVRRGPGFTPIIKADANARTVAVATLTFGSAGGRPAVASRFEILDERVQRDPALQAVVSNWTAIAYEAFRKTGFEPDRVIATLIEPLDGRESLVRNGPGPLTDLITAAFDREAGGVDVAIFNGGSVRIDDVIPAGPMTEYDVLRVLPFGGNVTKALVDGSLLASVLDTGIRNRGTGGYLHARGAHREGAAWVVRGAPLDPSRRYTVALTDFLISGGETNLGYLTRNNPAVHEVRDLGDVRAAVITEIRARYAPK